MDALKRIVDLTKAAVPVATATADSAYRRGRLAVLSKLGRVDESSDPAFCARKQASGEIERVQVEMHRRFDRVVDLLHSVGLELEAVTALIIDFHHALDIRTASSAFASPGDRDRMEALCETLRTNSVKLTLLAEAASQTLKQSCTGIIGSSLNTLRVDVGKARAAVRESQVSMDLARADAIAASDHCGVAEATYEDARTSGLTGKSLDTFHAAAESSRRIADEKQVRAEAKIAAYKECLRVSTTQFDFAIDQVSMATWSCFNVFFTELGNVLKDGAPVAAQISTTIRDLKNMQSIAKQLTRERRDRLDRERNEALYEHRGEPLTAAVLSASDTLDGVESATNFFDTITTSRPTAAVDAASDSPRVGPSSAPAPVASELDDIFGPSSGVHHHHPQTHYHHPQHRTAHPSSAVGTHQPQLFADPFATDVFTTTVPTTAAPATATPAARRTSHDDERPLTPRTLDFEEIFGR